MCLWALIGLSLLSYTVGCHRVQFWVQFYLHSIDFLWETLLVSLKGYLTIAVMMTFSYIFSFIPSQIENLSVLYDCLSAIMGWMANNFLQLNADKSEILVVGTDSTVSKVTNSIGSLSSIVHSNLKNLSVFFDQAMNFEKFISHLSHTCFFHLRNIAKLRSTICDLN